MKYPVSRSCFLFQSDEEVYLITNYSGGLRGRKEDGEEHAPRWISKGLGALGVGCLCSFSWLRDSIHRSGPKIQWDGGVEKPFVFTPDTPGDYLGPKCHFGHRNQIVSEFPFYTKSHLTLLLRP